jgi:hypothetical protein
MTIRFHFRAIYAAGRRRSCKAQTAEWSLPSGCDSLMTRPLLSLFCDATTALLRFNRRKKKCLLAAQRAGKDNT